MAVCPNCFHSYKNTDKHCSFCGKLFPQALTEQMQGISATTEDELQTGTIRDYQKVMDIEIGDFCPAYFAEKNGKRFLIKKMPLSCPEDEASKRIVANESNVYSSLKYPGLPETFEFVREGNDLFTIFGVPFGRRLVDFVYPEKNPDGSVSEQKIVVPDIYRALRWTRQVVRAVSFLHHQIPFAIIHRNLSPLTLIISQSADQIVCLDFGLLNAYRNAANLAASDELILTPGPFNPPNIFSENWGDPRTDIYSCGRLLDFILTGYIPEEFHSPACFPEKETKLDSRIRDRISRIIMGCLQTFTGDGYQTVDEIQVDIEKALTSEETDSSGLITCVCGHSSLESIRFCQKCGRLLHPKTDDGRSEVSQLLQFDDALFQELTKTFEQKKTAPLHRFQLREELDFVQSTPGFEELISLDELPLIEKMPHQKEAALVALKFMKGRALLADEVGLGKTIEAGMVLKELVRRSLVSKILILCPTQLRSQWQAELFQKFNEVFLILGRDIDTPLAWFSDHLIVSYHAILDPFHRDILLSQNYGLVILDEAHNLNISENEEILQVVKNLQKKYFLLLSATPMHNSLEELYNIITLLRPGHFEDFNKFCKEFIDPETNRPRLENIENLRHSLHEVMIRHSREQVRKEYHFPERSPQTWSLEISTEAKKFYDSFRQFYKEGVADISNPKVLELLNSIVERLCSSKRAFGETIASLKFNKSIQRQFKGINFLTQLEAFHIQYPKTLIAPKLDKLAQILLSDEMKRERVLVFSQFQETATFIKDELNREFPQLRERIKLYDENTSSAERDRVIDIFREKSNTILICPGEASEGLNLQMASFMINFDLPWDPMKLEQRIGRIQRIGGKHKINIFNLILKDTIEADILTILQDKIKIFEAVVGQVEAIIGNIQDEVDIPTIIGNIFVERKMELIEEKPHTQSNVIYDEYEEDGAEEDFTEEKQINPMEYLDIKLQQPQESNLLNEVYFDLDALDQL